MVKNFFKNEHKSAFSLFEACVVMLIVAVFVALCANAYTKRHVTYQESDGHGRYECYRNGGGIVQRYIENNSVRNLSGTTCVFRPPRYAKYILINAIGGGTATGAGQFISTFYSSIDAPLTIDPAAAGSNTEVRKGNDKIVTAGSGGGDMVVTNSGADKVAKCTVNAGFKADDATLGPPYSCDSTPTCAQDGSKIVVYYCKSPSELKRMDISLSDLKTNRFSYSGNTIVYQDIQDYVNVGHLEPADAIKMISKGTRPYNSYFSLSVEFDMSQSTESQMENYLSILGIEDGIADINPGAPGSPGGVVILW